MNIIVSNKYDALLSTLNIDVMSKITGVFTVEDLVNQFKNTFFNKMIIDITSIDKYQNIVTIQKLSLAFPMDKVILLLDDSQEANNPVFLSQLVSMGIYNFTKDINQVVYLISNSNTYKDVASYQMLDMNSGEAEKKVQDYNNSSQMSMKKVIGVVNVTDHAGATTLTYILMKHLYALYKTKAVEVGNSDLTYFQDPNTDSIQEDSVKDYIDSHDNLEAIVMDITSASDAIKSYCNDIIYLVEPGIIQLNKVINKDKETFEKLYNKKLVLNRSILNQRDIEDFERESGCKVFCNIPNIDDKQDNIKIIKKLLLDLGFSRFNNNDKHNFSLFK